MSTCPELPTPVAPLTLRLEGLKLGQRALFTCPVGYTIEGVSNATCLASGNLSPIPIPFRILWLVSLIHSIRWPEYHNWVVRILHKYKWRRYKWQQTKCDKCNYWLFLGLFVTGNWSSPPPTCNPVQCPSLYLEDPHLSLTELNTSAYGRAVFKCSWGYRLNGPSSVECEPSGTWNGPVPRCRGLFTKTKFTTGWHMLSSRTKFDE